MSEPIPLPAAPAPGPAFQPPDAGIVAVFAALSDATRLAILERLRGGELCVCDLQGVLGASQPRLSFHLKALKNARLVVDRRAGRWVYYSLRPGAVEEALGHLAALLAACCPPSLPKE